MESGQVNYGIFHIRWRRMCNVWSFYEALKYKAILCTVFWVYTYIKYIRKFMVMIDTKLRLSLGGKERYSVL